MKLQHVDLRGREMYVAPNCECIEICSEGILCASNPSSLEDEGVFGAEGDRLGGEW